MSAPSELYINETCRDEFTEILNKSFGEDKWILHTIRYNELSLSQLPKYMYVPIFNEKECLGMAIITNEFQIEYDDFGDRIIVPTPVKIEVCELKKTDKICMQCQPNMHSQTLHSPEGCIVYGCGCRLVNITRKQV